MVAVESIELLAQSLCFTSAILFAFIATFSRSQRAENAAQNAITILLVASAATLWWWVPIGIATRVRKAVRLTCTPGKMEFGLKRKNL